MAIQGGSAPALDCYAKLAMTHVTGGGVAGLDHGAVTIHILGV